MGMILTEANRPQVGEYHYRRVLALTGARDPILLANLAWNLKIQGRIAEARAFYEEFVAGRRGVRRPARLGAAWRKRTATSPGAAELLDRAEAVAPGNPSVHWPARCCMGAPQYDQAIGRARQFVVRRQAVSAQRVAEKGRLLDKMGRPQEAFAAFREGKRKARELSGIAYLADHAHDMAGG